jgi:hypothetical protein
MQLTVKELRALIKESIISEMGNSSNRMHFLAARVEAAKKRLIALSDADEHEIALIDDAIKHLEAVLSLR